MCVPQLHHISEPDGRWVPEAIALRQAASSLSGVSVTEDADDLVFADMDHENPHPKNARRLHKSSCKEAGALQVFAVPSSLSHADQGRAWHALIACHFPCFLTTNPQWKPSAQSLFLYGKSPMMPCAVSDTGAGVKHGAAVAAAGTSRRALPLHRQRQTSLARALPSSAPVHGDRAWSPSPGLASKGSKVCKGD